MSWVQHLQALNVTNYLVGAMDQYILASLARRSINVFDMQSGEKVVQQHLLNLIRQWRDAAVGCCLPSHVRGIDALSFQLYR